MFENVISSVISVSWIPDGMEKRLIQICSLLSLKTVINLLMGAWVNMEGWKGQKEKCLPGLEYWQFSIDVRFEMIYYLLRLYRFLRKNLWTKSWKQWSHCKRKKIIPLCTVYTTTKKAEIALERKAYVVECLRKIEEKGGKNSKI